MEKINEEIKFEIKNMRELALKFIKILDYKKENMKLDYIQIIIIIKVNLKKKKKIQKK